MEQTALRPKAMPGAPRNEQGVEDRVPGPRRRPHAARRRGRRLVTLSLGLLLGAGLVLSGVGLGTVGAAVVGMSKLAEMRQRAEAAEARPPSPPPTSEHASPPPRSTEHASPPPDRPLRAALGVEAVDAPKGEGALVVGVHVPGPGYTAGLVRGDVLVAIGGTPVDSANGLAGAVEAAPPGQEVTLTVLHASGAHQVLSATPGVVV
ncbi:PDZ domain-containing protein [Streptomyces sp. NPDC046821]|uniref:PDZ domain-containing protein n=1 Tax=Streptomyces sp. NPDC046821 TaxID=3154702 RepID=UPI0033FE1CD6